MIPYDFSLLTPRPKDGKGIPQNTQEWLDARRGRITASERAYKMITGRPWTVARMLDEMARELTEPATDGPKVEAMVHGHKWEVPAILDYKMMRLAKSEIVINPGMFIHPEFDIAAATPDFFEGEDGTGQVKCPMVLRNHLVLLHQGVKSANWKYYVQVQFESFITGRPKIIFCSYHDQAKPCEKLHYEIVPVDPGMHERFRQRLEEITHMLVNNERPNSKKEIEGIPELF